MMHAECGSCKQLGLVKQRTQSSCDVCACVENVAFISVDRRRSRLEHKLGIAQPGKGIAQAGRGWRAAQRCKVSTAGGRTNGFGARLHKTGVFDGPFKSICVFMCELVAHRCIEHGRVAFSGRQQQRQQRTPRIIAALPRITRTCRVTSRLCSSGVGHHLHTLRCTVAHAPAEHVGGSRWSWSSVTS